MLRQSKFRNKTIRIHSHDAKRPNAEKSKLKPKPSRAWIIPANKESKQPQHSSNIGG